MCLISFRNVSYSYDGRQVLSNISFRVNEGDYLCIVGENGSGKSTFIKGLLGIKKHNSGNIKFKNLKRNEIGYLPQQTNVQRDFPASVFEVVLSGFQNRLPMVNYYSKKMKREANKQLEYLGIGELKKRCYRELSGGQQQRVLFARALCSSKKLLVLDEPVSGLDPLISKEMYHIIEDLNKNHNVTIIMVSHDIESVIGYASHVFHLENMHGFYGTKAEYISSDFSEKFWDGDKND